MSDVLAAIYARVSSEQQADEHTIDSQVAAQPSRRASASLTGRTRVPGRRLEWRDAGPSGTGATARSGCGGWD